MSILEVKHVTKYFGKRLVLNDVNFSVDAGECLGIVGLSGGGKSTLAKIIARLIDWIFHTRRATPFIKICR